MRLSSVFVHRLLNLLLRTRLEMLSPISTNNTARGRDGYKTMVRKKTVLSVKEIFVRRINRIDSFVRLKNQSKPKANLRAMKRLATHAAVERHKKLPVAFPVLVSCLPRSPTLSGGVWLDWEPSTGRCGGGVDVVCGDAPGRRRGDGGVEEIDQLCYTLPQIDLA
jgi:hypothetical protein